MPPTRFLSPRSHRDTTRSEHASLRIIGGDAANLASEPVVRNLASELQSEVCTIKIWRARDDAASPLQRKCCHIDVATRDQAVSLLLRRRAAPRAVLRPTP